MSLNGDIKFQKTLALATSASNSFEAEAAELAARRLMTMYRIDPTDIPDRSLYSHDNFAGNPLLKKLRDEWREQHPVVIVAKRHSWQSDYRTGMTVCRNCGLHRFKYEEAVYRLRDGREWHRFAPTCPPEPPREREQADNEKRKTAPPAFDPGAAP